MSGATAKVIRISENSEQRLADAIRSGILTADAERAYRQVLEENERLQRENMCLRIQLRVVRRSRAIERQCKTEAYRMVLAEDSEYQQHRDWRLATYIGLISLGGIAVALLTCAAVL